MNLWLVELLTFIKRKTFSNWEIFTVLKWESSCTKEVGLCCTKQRWLESLFQTPTPFLFQNFWIKVRQSFKSENPTAAQTPATIIDPTIIYPCFHIRNDHTDSCYCRSWKVTPGTVFLNFLTPVRIRFRKKCAKSCRSWLRFAGSGVKRNFWLQAMCACTE